MLSISTAQSAIKAALQGRWEEAVEYNLAILDPDPADLDALNRLAKAYTQLGQISKAQTTYQKVLKIDRYNQIAQRNLPKITSLKSAPPLSPSSGSTQANIFIEEPGKTRTVKLIKVTNTKLISQLNPGDTVFLSPRTRTISVTTQDDTYIGTLPDDLSRHLIKLIGLGNKYQAVIRLTQKNIVQVLIRETYRSKRTRQVPSFIS